MKVRVCKSRFDSQWKVMLGIVVHGSFDTWGKAIRYAIGGKGKAA
jgi:hypothetical protein